MTTGNREQPKYSGLLQHKDKPTAAVAMNLKPFTVLRVVWSDVANVVREMIPPLDFNQHKGMMGRIGVFGGSRDYTGAPFYAATSSLKFGSDLSFIFCSESAAIPIKCYSPELMVTPLYRDSSLEDIVTRDSEVRVRYNIATVL